LASTKNSRRQNLGIDKRLASTNLGVNKILASTKSWRQQNTCVNKILASAQEESTAAEFSQTSLKISFFLLMVLFSPYVVAMCDASSAHSAFMDGFSPVLYQLIVLARHAEIVKKSGAT
jgi:hypothetical protein